MPERHQNVRTSDTRTEEGAAHLGKVHQPGDAGLVRVQPCESLLPCRQDLIPSALAGHIGRWKGRTRLARSRRVAEARDAQSKSHGPDQNLNGIYSFTSRSIYLPRYLETSNESYFSFYQCHMDCTEGRG